LIHRLEKTIVFIKNSFPDLKLKGSKDGELPWFNLFYFPLIDMHWSGMRKEKIVMEVI